MIDYASPDAADAIDAAIEDALIDVHVALPAIVVSYDAAAQTARLALGVRRVLTYDDGTQTTEALPELLNVPVAFPRSARFALHFELAAGDTGTVVFAETSIDQWRSKGGADVPPGDARRHSLTGAVFWPGLTPNAGALADPGLESGAMMGHVGGAQARFRADTVEITTGGAATADDFVALAGKVRVALDILAATFNAWTPVALDGGAALKAAWTAANLPIPLDSDVASSNLKAD